MLCVGFRAIWVFSVQLYEVCKGLGRKAAGVGQNYPQSVHLWGVSLVSSHPTHWSVLRDLWSQGPMWGRVSKESASKAQEQGGRKSHSSCEGTWGGDQQRHGRDSVRSMEGQKGGEGRGECATALSVCEHPWRGRKRHEEEGNVP